MPHSSACRHTVILTSSYEDGTKGRRAILVFDEIAERPIEDTLLADTLSAFAISAYSHFPKMVEPMGVEPTNNCLQSSRLYHTRATAPLKLLVEVGRVELPAFSMPLRCSTVELSAH